MDDINNFERKITTDFAKFGRRFMVGDIIIRSCGEMLHLYVNENKDGIDSIKDHEVNFKSVDIETILDNSVDI